MILEILLENITKKWRMKKYMIKGRLREQVLDLFILGSSIFIIILGILMLYWCIFILEITNAVPYFMYLFLIFLGINGFRVYRKEVEL
jgi:hypothetical protein